LLYVYTVYNKWSSRKKWSIFVKHLTPGDGSMLLLRKWVTWIISIRRSCTNCRRNDTNAYLYCCTVHS
jgi:hypothetical protein